MSSFHVFKSAHFDAGYCQKKCSIHTACLTQTTAEFSQSLVCEHDMPVTNGFSL